MFVDMKDVGRIRDRTHIVEIEHRYWLDYSQEEILTALAESYFYMMAHEFPGFKILGGDVEHTVFQDFDTRTMKFAVWWAPGPEECYFPELGFGRSFAWEGRTNPKLRIAMAKPLGRLSAYPKPTESVIDVLGDLHDNYEVTGWSDTLQAWIYKKEK